MSRPDNTLRGKAPSASRRPDPDRGNPASAHSDGSLFGPGRSQRPKRASGGASQTSSAERSPALLNARSPDATRLLTADDLAERWQVRAKQVYSLTRQGVLPVVRIGRYCRYRLDAIEAWERDQEGDAS